MSTWIKLLPLELDSIKDADIIDPGQELREGDHVVGDMSRTAKQLFTLARMLEREADQLLLTRKYCVDKRLASELDAKIDQYKTKSQFVRDALWISIKDDMGLWSTNAGVRIGFKVVTYECDEADNPFRKLFGL